MLQALGSAPHSLALLPFKIQTVSAPGPPHHHKPTHLPIFTCVSFKAQLSAFLMMEFSRPGQPAAASLHCSEALPHAAGAG